MAYYTPVNDKWIFYQGRDGDIKKITCNGNEIQCCGLEITYAPFSHCAKITINATNFVVENIEYSQGNSVAGKD